MESAHISTQPESDSEVNGRLSTGKENMVGRAIFRGLEMLCPVSTNSPLAIAEQPELRAYKLGKQKCSYNQVELVIKDVGAGSKVADLKVSEAIETCAGSEVDEQLRESCLKFNVRFVNNNRMHLYIYVVYGTPYGSIRTDKHSVMYHWIPVTRSKCRKGCKGPVIRGLQRFGRMPRRSATTLDGEDSWKEPRHLYIAIDEASTHVCPRHETSKFRLLVAAYDDKNFLLGTTVSSSIRVLANNDAPLGAASFKLHCHIKGPRYLRAGGWGAGTDEYSLRNTNYNGQAIERPALIRSPLQDILQNSSPPRSYKSTTIDEMAKQLDNIGPLQELEHNQLTNEKGFDHECLSGGKLRLTGADEAVVYPKADKDHSLTDLCHRMFKACVAKQEHGQATITLRGLANTLGARRKRILEILNVLESIQVVHHQGKERYTWIGSCQIARALVKLKCNIPAVREPVDTVTRSFLSPIRRGKVKAALPRQIEDMRTEANNPMRVLSKMFIQLFLVHERNCSVPWDQILERIVDGQGHDPETMRAKTRRLGEIARIFSALHLIRKVVNQGLQSGVFYEWLGAQGVAEHLVNINIAKAGPASMIKKVGGRSISLHQEFNSPTRQEKRGPEGLRGQIVYDHGSGLADANQHLQTSEDAPAPGSHSQFNGNGERPGSGRKFKRNTTDVDENAPVSDNFITSEKNSDHTRLHNPPNGLLKPGYLSNHILASCGGFALSAAYRFCQTTLVGHIRGEISSQLALEARPSVSDHVSQLPTWRIQAPFLSSGKTSRAPEEMYGPYASSVPQLPEVQRKKTYLPSLSAFGIDAKIDRDSYDLEILDSPYSSDRADEGFTSPNKTDEGSTTTERLNDVEDSDNLVTHKHLSPGTSGECLPKIVHGCPKRHELNSVASEPCERQDSETSKFYCDSLLAREEEDALQWQPRVKRIARSHDHTSGVSCNAAHQFPYKKRKFDVTSFTSLEQSNECDHTRDSQPSPLHEKDDRELVQEHKENLPTTFDPLFHLLRFYNPKRIFEFQSQNPGFLFTYVKESRALYHKWCAQSASQTVIRPVANVGKISTAKSDPAFPAIPSAVAGYCQPNMFISASH